MTECRVPRYAAELNCLVHILLLTKWTKGCMTIIWNSHNYEPPPAIINNLSAGIHVTAASQTGSGISTCAIYTSRGPLPPLQTLPTCQVHAVSGYYMYIAHGSLPNGTELSSCLTDNLTKPRKMITSSAWACFRLNHHLVVTWTPSLNSELA